MTFQQPWWLLLLGLIAIIFVLHANRRRQITVTSLYLWQQVQGHDDLKRPTRRFPPPNLLLILQVLAVILLTLALARPQFTAGAPDHWVVMLDTSVTMAEHGAESDLDQLLDQRNSSLLTVVEVAGSPVVRATRLNDRRLLADLERTFTHENSDWLSALRLIEGTVLEAESTLVTVLGPPDAIREAHLLLAAMLPGTDTEYVPVGPDLPNNRFVNVEVSHADGTWTVSGTVAGDAPVRVSFQPHGAATALEWAEMQTVDRRFTGDFSFPGAGTLELLLPEDAASADNVYRLELLDTVPEVRVLQVGTEDPVLRRALLAAGAAAVEYAAELPDDAAADLVITSGTQSGDLPATVSLVFGAHGTATAGGLAPVAAAPNSLTDGVDFSALDLTRANILEPAEGDTVLLESPAGPLALIRHTPAGTQIAIGFEPTQGNWHNTPSFPVFIANVLDLAVPQRGTRTALSCLVGESCTVPRGTAPVDPAGLPVQVNASGSFVPRLAGTYLLDGNPLHVNATGAARSVATAGPLPAATSTRAVPDDIWRWLAVAAAVLLLAEMILARGRRLQGSGRTTAGSMAAQALAAVLLLVALLQLPVPTPVRTQVKAVLAGPETAQQAPAGMPGVVLGDTADAASVPRGAVADGLKLAAGLLPAGGTVLLETDGLVTRGALADAATALSTSGIRLEVIAQPATPGEEVLVAGVNAPAVIHEQQPFELTATVHSTHAQTALVDLYRNGVITDEQTVELVAGMNTVTFGATDDAGTWLYEVGLQGEMDSEAGNNRHGRIVQVGPAPRVTIVTRHTELGEVFAHALSLQGMTAAVTTPVYLPRNAEGFQGHDAFILLDVPALEFHSSQLIALEEWVSTAGGGLLILGGANTFGPGGYYQTPLEDLSPLSSLVDREAPEVALLFVLDRSGSMQQAVGETNRLEIAKEATLGAIRALGADSRVGIIVFDAVAEVLVPLTPTADPEPFETALATLTASGGTSIYPALQHALAEMEDVDASARHVIVMTDGLSQPGDFESILRELRELQVTVSTVAIGSGADVRGLANIARLGAGATHATTDFRALPSILGQEALLLSGSSVEEQTIQPVWETAAAGRGFQFLADAAPLHGFVRTTAKEDADLHLSAVDDGLEEVPLLATWKYGLGNVAAFASSGVGEWAADWQEMATFPALWSQLVRWTLPEVISPGLTVSTSMNGAELDVTVTAVDAEGRPDTGLDLEAVLLSPDGEPADVRLLRPIHPGEYRTALLAAESGVNWLGIGSRPGTGSAIQPWEQPVFVPYPAVLDFSAADLRPLEQLAARTGGQVAEAADLRAEWSLLWVTAPAPVLWLLASLAAFLCALYWRYARMGRR